MANIPFKPYEILGFGSACVDLIYRIDEKFLHELKIKKGDGRSLDWQSFSKILETCASHNLEPVLSTGGSTANTIKGLASLGNLAAFYGKRGDDPLGIFFEDSIRHLGIHPLLSLSEAPTSQIGVFVTPDHQRSFLSYSGANRLMDQEKLQDLSFKNVRLVHIEGYMIDELPLPYIENIMQTAKRNGALISLDMGCARIAKTYTDTILRLLKSYVDIVFANQDEVLALLGLDPKQGAAELAKLCRIASIGIGKDGCWVASDSQLFQSPAFDVEVIDTTGAGDLFACGFLHAYMHGYKLPDCAKIGNLLGGTAVTILGAEIPASKWPEIIDKIKDRLERPNDL